VCEAFRIVTAPAPSPRQRFTAEIRRSDEDLDLARAALLVAQEEYPQLPLEIYLSRLDQLAEEVCGRLGQETAPLLVLQELLETLYRRQGFKGNREAYYDPRNSFLNDVLDRRAGIPLTLGIVLLEVGWRLDLPLEGVTFPHHFMVRFRGEGMHLLLDPFDGGEVRFEDEAQELLDRVYGGMVRVQPGFLRRAARRDMLVRLLTNLKGVYMNARDHRRALAVVERILLLRPDAGSERRTLGLLLARMGRHEEARAELRTYLEGGPDPRDARQVERLMGRLGRGDDPGLGEDLDEELSP
jgi:regulator of sirC expression with transglutaminase-like and TPR domain